MYPDLLRKTAWATAVVLSLACISCSRQSVESKRPVAEQQSTDAATSPFRTSGTAGTAVDPAALPASAATIGSDATTERDPGAIKALEDMSAYLRTLKAFQVHLVTSRDEVLED